MMYKKLTLGPAILLAMFYSSLFRCEAQSANPQNTQSYNQKTSDTEINKAEEDLTKAIAALNDAMKLAPDQEPEITPIINDLQLQKDELEILSTPGNPKLTIRGGSTHFDNTGNGHDFAVNTSDGKSATAIVQSAVKKIYLNNFFTDAAGTHKAPDQPVGNNWNLIITYRNPDGTSDDHKFITVCSQPSCQLGGSVTATTITINNTNGGYGQFYSDDDSSQKGSYILTDACQGSPKCDHISKITINTLTAISPNTFYCTDKKGRCNIHLK